MNFITMLPFVDTLSFSVFNVLLVSVDCRCCEPWASDGMSHLQLTRSIHETQSRFLLFCFVLKKSQTPRVRIRVESNNEY